MATMLLCWSVIGLLLQIACATSGGKCQTGSYGKHCELTCPGNCINRNCKIIAKTGQTHCVEGCVGGFQGYSCLIKCRRERCIQCKQLSDECVICMDGYYGTHCLDACPAKCKNRHCSMNGTCLNSIETCIGPFYGPMCNISCNPLYATCSRNGSCLSCIHGRYGDNCEFHCPVCLHNYTFDYFQCKSGCELVKCKRGDESPANNYELEVTILVYNVIVVSLAVVLLGFILVYAWSCLRRNSTKKRSNAGSLEPLMSPFRERNANNKTRSRKQGISTLFQAENGTKGDSTNTHYAGCLAQGRLNLRLRNLEKVYVKTNAYDSALSTLEEHMCVTLTGKMGAGKTCLAMKLCDSYQQKAYNTLFVQDIDGFDETALLKADSDTLFVFQDVFNPDKGQTRWHTLENIIYEQIKSMRKIRFADNEKYMHSIKSCFVFTSHSDNFGKHSEISDGLFCHETVIDLTLQLTPSEKKDIIHEICTDTRREELTVAETGQIVQISQDEMGFPLVCYMYFANQEFQNCSTKDFFQSPLHYLREDIQAIVSKRDNASAALTLPAAFGGEFDFKSFQRQSTASDRNVFSILLEQMPECTIELISLEARKLDAVYLSFEHPKVSYTHSAVFDAVVDAMETCDLSSVFKKRL